MTRPAHFCFPDWPCWYGSRAPARSWLPTTALACSRAVRQSHSDNDLGLLRRIQRVRALLVKLVLQLQTHAVGFDCPDGLHQALDLRIHTVLAQFLAGC